MRRSTRNHGERSRAGCGLTLLEVIVATFTLALAAGTIMGGIGFMRNVAERNHLRLDAMEVAHRIILQHIDDDAALRSQVKRVALNGNFFAYTLVEQIVIDDTNDTRGQASTHSLTLKSIEQADTNEWLTSKVYLVRVQVFADNDHSGPAGKVPLADLSRVYNWLRDADAMMVKLRSSAAFGSLIQNQNLGGSGPGIVLPSPNGSSGGGGNKSSGNGSNTFNNSGNGRPRGIR